MAVEKEFRLVRGVEVSDEKASAELLEELAEQRGNSPMVGVCLLWLVCGLLLFQVEDGK